MGTLHDLWGYAPVFIRQVGMAAPRASGQGYLKIAELGRPDRLGSAIGEPVRREDQVKGYELGMDDYVRRRADGRKAHVRKRAR